MASSAQSFRVAGVPVTVSPSIVLILGFLGFTIPDTTASRVAIVIVLGLASILVHELGHAAAARLYGGTPTVRLEGLGGATDPGFTTVPGRGSLIVLALAGPGAGLLVGLVILGAVVVSSYDVSYDGSLVSFTVIMALWMNIGWSLFNLVPVLPLDGGRLLTELLPGDRIVRTRRAHLVSVVIGGIGAVLLIMNDFIFGGFIVGMLAGQSLGAYRKLGVYLDTRDSATTLEDVGTRLATGQTGAEVELRQLLDDEAAGPYARTLLVEHLARQGRADDARDAIGDLRDRAPTSTFLVEVLETNGERGVESLLEAYRTSPSPLAARHVVVALDAVNRADEIGRAIGTTPDAPELLGILNTAQSTAHHLGAYAAAAELGALTYARLPDAGGVPAFNVACSLARSDEVDSALAWLEAALERGLDDPTIFDTDDDLGSLRSSARFAELRQRAFGLT